MSERYTVVIPGRQPRMETTGTVDEIVAWLRGDWNRDVGGTERHPSVPKYDNNVAYMHKITYLTFRRSGVTPKWDPSDTEPYDPWQFLLYMSAVGAIKFVGDNAPESESMYADEIKSRHDVARALAASDAKDIVT